VFKCDVLPLHVPDFAQPLHECVPVGRRWWRGIGRSRNGEMTDSAYRQLRSSCDRPRRRTAENCYEFASSHLPPKRTLFQSRNLPPHARVASRNRAAIGWTSSNRVDQAQCLVSVKTAVLTLCRSLPIYPRERTYHRSRGWFGSIEEHRDDREIGKLPPVGAAPNRGRSHILGFWCVLGYGVIAPRRSNSAHLHRPWRATQEYATDAKRLRFYSASRCDGGSFFGVRASVPTWLHAFVQHPHDFH